jgi:PAS domain S-box-containing protein
VKRRPRRGLATWITSSRTPLFVLDDRRVVLVFNRGCEELTQWSAAEVIGKSCEFLSIAQPDQVECLTSALAPPRAAIEGVAQVVETLIRRRDGSSLPRRIQFVPLRESDDRERTRILGIILDADDGTPPATGGARHVELAHLVADLHQRYGVDRIVARSPEMQRVAAQVELARGGTVSVHFMGESGTGKEHLARLIHYGSDARGTRFVPVRCRSGSHFELSRTIRRLLETGESAPVGTVYLDQVDHLPRDLQARLLEKIDETAIRWTSSSAGGVDELSEERFDPQLRCRLTSLMIRVPPLRERGEDLLLLAQQILEEGNRELPAPRERFSSEVERLFRQYAWPGNVEELASVVQQAARKCSGPEVAVGDLPIEFTSGMDAQSLGPAEPERIDLERYLNDVEREQIDRALTAARGNKAAAAERLGIPRARLYRRMAALGITDPEES